MNTKAIPAWPAFDGEPGTTPTVAREPKPQFYVAHLETQNFTFDAFGVTESAAREALVAGMRKHGKQYSLPRDWWKEFYDDVSVTGARWGQCNRDHQPL